MIFSAHFSYNQ